MRAPRCSPLFKICLIAFKLKSNPIKKRRKESVLSGKPPLCYSSGGCTARSVIENWKEKKPRTFEGVLGRQRKKIRKRLQRWDKSEGQATSGRPRVNFVVFKRNSRTIFCSHICKSLNAFSQMTHSADCLNGNKQHTSNRCALSVQPSTQDMLKQKPTLWFCRNVVILEEHCGPKWKLWSWRNIMVLEMSCGLGETL